MPRTGNTTQRGYGAAHQAARAALITAHVDGTMCPRFGTDPLCPGPMFLTDELDAGHSVDLAVDPLALPDRLEHRACNRRAGSALAHSPRCRFHSNCGSVHSNAW